MARDLRATKASPIDVRIGTSGFSFEDWRAVFYPPDLPKGQMLEWYVRSFRTVEINSTYYRIPHPAVMANLTRKVPEGFEFMVKAPSGFTHTRRQFAAEISPFYNCLQPMRQAGQLAGVVSQFPYSFKRGNENLTHVLRCRDAVAPISMYVEFRHDSWVTTDTLRALHDEQIGYVSVDEPQLPGLLAPDLHATTDIGYLRLHGRNAAAWWDGGDQRYNYEYSETELKEWRDRIRRVKDRVRRLYVYFNNCYGGGAARNAVAFEQLFRSR